MMPKVPNGRQRGQSLTSSYRTWIRIFSVPELRPPAQELSELAPRSGDLSAGRSRVAEVLEGRALSLR